MKILAYDLETSPSQFYGWELYDEHTPHNMVIREGGTILCAAWRFTHQRKTSHVAVDPEQKDMYDDYDVMAELYEALSQADVVLAHNGKKFDNRVFNTRCIFHGFDPLPPIPTIDTLLAARKRFRFLSNRLDHLGDRLGVGRKIRTGGFDLWGDIIQAKEKAEGTLDIERRRKALNKMIRYNKRDVDLLVDVYHEMLPWIDNHPNRALYTDGQGCPICGSSDIKSNGTRKNRTTIYRQYHCKSCGAWPRSRKSGRFKPELTL